MNSWAVLEFVGLSTSQ